MKSNQRNLLTFTLAAVTLSTAASASTGPGQQSVNEISTGYEVADKLAEGKCGEGKCGGKKASEHKCGEGKCGGKKTRDHKCGEGKCGGKKAKDHKCGESRCGSMADKVLDAATPGE